LWLGMTTDRAGCKPFLLAANEFFQPAPGPTRFTPPQIDGDAPEPSEQAGSRTLPLAAGVPLTEARLHPDNPSQGSRLPVGPMFARVGQQRVARQDAQVRLDFPPVHRPMVND